MVDTICEPDTTLVLAEKTTHACMTTSDARWTTLGYPSSWGSPEEAKAHAVKFQRVLNRQDPETGLALPADPPKAPKRPREEPQAPRKRLRTTTAANTAASEARQRAEAAPRPKKRGPPEWLLANRPSKYKKSFTGARMQCPLMGSLTQTARRYVKRRNRNWGNARKLIRHGQTVRRQATATEKRRADKSITAFVACIWCREASADIQHHVLTMTTEQLICNEDRYELTNFDAVRSFRQGMVLTIFFEKLAQQQAYYQQHGFILQTQRELALEIVDTAGLCLQNTKADHILLWSLDYRRNASLSLSMRGRYMRDWLLHMEDLQFQLKDWMMVNKDDMTVDSCTLWINSKLLPDTEETRDMCKEWSISYPIARCVPRPSACSLTAPPAGRLFGAGCTVLAQCMADIARHS